MNTSSRKNSTGKIALLLAGVTGILLWAVREKLWFDPATYSAGFADQETHLGVSNFWNVATNVGFAILGVYGIRSLPHFPEVYRRLALIFSLAIFGTALGSSYFHYAPTPERLFWDQLPMSIGFASFVGMVVADRVSPRIGQWLGYSLCLIGPWSVWNIYYGGGETAYYLSLQFGTLIFAILLLLGARVGEMRTGAIFGGLVAYIFAKVFETNDAAIFSSLGFSGHSLKHLAATVALAAILRGAQRSSKLG